jgi:hypothetical protein
MTTQNTHAAPAKGRKITIGGESFRNLNAHSTGNADGEIWLWGPVVNSYGDKEWGVNKGRNGTAYSVAKFYTRKEATANVRELRRERAATKNGGAQ